MVLAASLAVLAASLAVLAASLAVLAASLTVLADSLAGDVAMMGLDILVLIVIGITQSTESSRVRGTVSVHHRGSSSSSSSSRVEHRLMPWLVLEMVDVDVGSEFDSQHFVHKKRVGR